MALAKEDRKLGELILIIVIVFVFLLFHQPSSNYNRGKDAKRFLNAFYHCDKYCAKLPCEKSFPESNYYEYSLCFAAEGNCNCDRWNNNAAANWNGNKTLIMALLLTFLFFFLWLYADIKYKKFKQKRLQSGEEDQLQSSQSQSRVYVVPLNLQESGNSEAGSDKIQKDSPPEYDPPPSYYEIEKQQRF